MEKNIDGVKKWLLLSLCTASVFFSLLLVNTPIVGALGGIRVNCSDGSEVSCNGYKCSGTENVGCTCRNSAGKVVDRHSCSGTTQDATEHSEE